MTDPFLDGLFSRSETTVVSGQGGGLSAAALRRLAGGVAQRLGGGKPALLWATPTVETMIGAVGALSSTSPLVPVNPHSGERELEHLLADAQPGCVIAGADDSLPESLQRLDRIVPSGVGTADLKPVGASEEPALILYTSGTTGPPKGVVLSRKAMAANLDALASAWGWRDSDVLAHSLPLFHVHGLVLGVLGPLRIGGEVRHLGSFDVARTCDALLGGATMFFGVPTMYHRFAALAEVDTAAARALGSARLLVSGSAPLSSIDHERLRRAAGVHVLERYGMTETLMIASAPLEGERRPGYVGFPLRGVDVRVEYHGSAVPQDDATIGDVWVRSPSLFSGYLNRPDATDATFRDGWFATGDLGVLAEDGNLRLVGRKSSDLIKSGAFRIGAGEIESALQAHPAVDEVAVKGLPDPDLGERIAAWIVLTEGASVSAEELIEHVTKELAHHKRPREIHFASALPRNAIGKVQKQRLGS